MQNLPNIFTKLGIVFEIASVIFLMTLLFQCCNPRPNRLGAAPSLTGCVPISGLKFGCFAHKFDYNVGQQAEPRLFAAWQRST